MLSLFFGYFGSTPPPTIARMLHLISISTIPTPIPQSVCLLADLAFVCGSLIASFHRLHAPLWNLSLRGSTENMLNPCVVPTAMHEWSWFSDMYRIVGAFVRAAAAACSVVVLAAATAMPRTSLCVLAVCSLCSLCACCLFCLLLRAGACVGGRAARSVKKQGKPKRKRGKETLPAAKLWDVRLVPSKKCIAPQYKMREMLVAFLFLFYFDFFASERRAAAAPASDNS